MTFDWQPFDAVTEVGAPAGTQGAIAEDEDLVVMVGTMPPIGMGKVALAVKTPGTDYDKVGIFEDMAGFGMSLDEVKQVAEEFVGNIPAEEMAIIVADAREGAARGEVDSAGEADSESDE